MIIEEFIQSYADQELQKLNKLAEREGVENFMELDLEYYALKTGPRNQVSPKNGSPKGNSPRLSPRGGGQGRKKALTIKEIRKGH